MNDKNFRRKNMQYTNNYESPIGKIIMASDGKGLSGLWFEGQKYFGSTLSSEYQELDLPIFEQTKQWLDLYFNGSPPNFTPLLSLNASSFYLEVWKILRKIPYGQVTTYGNIAKVIAESRKIKTMSAQAVGGAVGHNPISIIIPCHRVIGSNGNLTGYAGGIEKKKYLLNLEKQNVSAFHSN